MGYDTVYIRHGKESNSQPVSSKVSADSTIGHGYGIIGIFGGRSIKVDMFIHTLIFVLLYLDHGYYILTMDELVIQFDTISVNRLHELRGSGLSSSGGGIYQN